MNVTKLNKIDVIRRERVAFYCRVSSKSDAQENSFESQVQYYQRYQQMHPEYDYVGIYADEGLSGRLHQEKREGFYQMIKDAKDGLIDRIIVKSISRFSRNTVVGIKALKQLELLGVSVWFENNGIDTKLVNPELMVTALNFVAERESVKISEACIWGFRKRFEKGHYKHSVAPYGFKLINNGELIINEEQAIIVKKMYDMILDGYSATSIGKYLNQNNVVGAKGGKWDNRRVTSILRNERNIGDMLLQKHFSENNGENHKKRNRDILNQYYVMDTHPAIIEREVFEEVVSILNEKEKQFNRNTKANVVYPLSKKIKCIDCGATIRRRVCAKGKTYEAIKWGCSSTIDSSKKCSVKQIREDEIYTYVEQLVIQLRSNNFEQLKTYMDTLVDNSELQKNKEYQKLKTEFNKIKKQKAILEIETSNSYSAFLLEKLKQVKITEDDIARKIDGYEDKVSKYDLSCTQEIIEYLKLNDIENEIHIEKFIELYVKRINANNEEIIFILKGNYKGGYNR